MKDDTAMLTKSKFYYSSMKGNYRFNRNQRLFVIQGVISACVNTLITGVFMTGFILWLGVSEASVGIIITIPMLSSVLQIFFINIWSYTRDHKRLVILLILGSRLLIAAIVLLPLILPRNATIPLLFIKANSRFIVVALVLLVSYIFGALSALKLNLWIINTVERSFRGTFFSTRDRITIIITTILAFGVSKMLDIFKNNNFEYLGFVLIFSCTVILAFMDFIVMSKINYPQANEKEEKCSFMDLIKILIVDKLFMKVIIYLCLLNYGMNIALPFYNVYMINHLKLDYTQIMLLTMIQTIIFAFMSILWGRIANRTSWLKILRITSFLLGIQFFVWALISKQTIALLPFVFIIAGLIGPGLNMAMFNIPYGYLTKGAFSAYLSIVMAAVSISGFIGSLTGSRIISSLTNIKFSIGFIQIGSMQLNMGIAGIVIFISVFLGKTYVPNERRNN